MARMRLDSGLAFLTLWSVGLSMALGCGPHPDQVTQVAAPACAGAPPAPWLQPTAPFQTRLARDPRGGLVMLGNADPGATIGKVDDEGRLLWSAPIEGRSRAVAAAPGDGFLAATAVSGPPSDPAVRYQGSPRQQANVTKVDGNGQLAWQTVVSDGAGDLMAEFVGVTPEGDVIVSGLFHPDFTPSDFPNPPSREGGFLAKISPDGQVRWERHFEPGASRGFVIDASGRPAVIVWTSYALSIDDVMLEPTHDPWSGFLVSFDPEGRAVEARDVTVDGQQRFDRAVVDDQGRLYVAGFIGHDGGSYTSELVLNAFGASGPPLWDRRFSMNDQNEDARVAIDECGDVLLVGNGPGAGVGFLAVRLGRDGDVKARLTVSPAAGARVDEVAPAPGGIFVTGASDPNLQSGFVARAGL
jgi:hypothetical protein